MRICDVLKNLRESRGMSQLEMSKQSGISQSTISAIELGVRQPSMYMLGKLSDFFGVPITSFVGEFEATDDDTVQTVADSIFSNQKLASLFETARFLADDDLDVLIHVAIALRRGYSR